MTWRRRLRIVRRIGCQVEKEGCGIARAALDEIHGEVTQHIGDVVLGRVSVRDKLAILVEGVFVVGVLIVVRGWRPHVPFIPPGRYIACLISVEVFPDHGRPITAVLQPGRDGRLLGTLAGGVELPPPAMRRIVIQNAVVMDILPPQDRSTRRAAQWVVYERVRERCTLLHEELLHVGHELE